ncbi:hypothetical protein DFP74_4695 [Nocardiopsis sp. Huas11]|uniref:hypothetical protein n=1 Tax=Nocardiopsis sp. Huas11 TaxID=2183912 RepID=UPI000EAB5886|nr:hypothetical protein [Nocardiopsis sp. Huas11]RKS08968.1 hypothetical protein DFP74_4695 [Nocardiopsis sp. Huas11]
MSVPTATAAPDRPLRLVLRADALACVGAGLAMALGSTFLSGPLGLPTELLLAAGLFLLPFAALVWLLSSRQAVTLAGVAAVIVANVVWLLGSVAVVVLMAPSGLGVAFVLAQAAAVLALTVAETVLLRTSVKEGL